MPEQGCLFRTCFTETLESNFRPIFVFQKQQKFSSQILFLECNFQTIFFSEYLEARLLFDGSQDIVIYEQGGPECNVESSEQCEEQDGSGVNQHSGVTDFAKLIFKNLQKVSSKQAKIEILQGEDQTAHIHCFPLN